MGRREIALKKAHNKLNKETNIIENIKARRYVEEAIKYLIPHKKRLEIKERSRYLTIDPENESKCKQLQGIKRISTKQSSFKDSSVDYSSGFFSSSDSSSFHSRGSSNRGTDQAANLPLAR